VSKGGAVFDYKKLIWYNEHYLREKPVDVLWPRVKEIAEEHGIDPEEDYMKKIIPLMKDRVSKIEDFVTMGRFFFEDPEEYEEKALKKWKEDSAELLQAYVEKIEQLDEDEFKAKILKDNIKEVINAYDVGFGKLMMPLRVAVSGMGFGPDLTPTIELLGKETTIRRINTAIQKLG
jgi:glutamyl-tRNA synthetase